MAKKLAQAQAGTQSETVTDVKAEGIVDILGNMLAEGKPGTLSNKLPDVKDKTLDKIRH